MSLEVRGARSQANRSHCRGAFKALALIHICDHGSNNLWRVRPHLDSVHTMGVFFFNYTAACAAVGGGGGGGGGGGL